MIVGRRLAVNFNTHDAVRISMLAMYPDLSATLTGLSVWPLQAFITKVLLVFLNPFVRLALLSHYAAFSCSVLLSFAGCGRCRQRLERLRSAFCFGVTHSRLPRALFSESLSP